MSVSDLSEGDQEDLSQRDQVLADSFTLRSAESGKADSIALNDSIDLPAARETRTLADSVVLPPASSKASRTARADSVVLPPASSTGKASRSARADSVLLPPPKRSTTQPARLEEPDDAPPGRLTEDTQPAEQQQPSTPVSNGSFGSLSTKSKDTATPAPDEEDRTPRTQREQLARLRLLSAKLKETKCLADEGSKKETPRATRRELAKIRLLAAKAEKKKASPKKALTEEALRSRRELAKHRLQQRRRQQAAARRQEPKNWPKLGHSDLPETPIAEKALNELLQLCEEFELEEERMVPSVDECAEGEFLTSSGMEEEEDDEEEGGRRSGTADSQPRDVLLSDIAALFPLDETEKQRLRSQLLVECENTALAKRLKEAEEALLRREKQLARLLAGGHVGGSQRKTSPSDLISQFLGTSTEQLAALQEEVSQLHAQLEEKHRHIEASTLEADQSGVAFAALEEEKKRLQEEHEAALEAQRNTITELTEEKEKAEETIRLQEAEIAALKEGSASAGTELQAELANARLNEERLACRLDALKLVVTQKVTSVTPITLNSLLLTERFLPESSTHHEAVTDAMEVLLSKFSDLQPTGSPSLLGSHSPVRGEHFDRLAHVEDVRQRAFRMFLVYNPDKVSTKQKASCIDRFLEQLRAVGEDEEVLLEKLVDSYGPEPQDEAVHMASLKFPHYELAELPTEFHQSPTSTEQELVNLMGSRGEGTEASGGSGRGSPSGSLSPNQALQPEDLEWASAVLRPIEGDVECIVSTLLDCLRVEESAMLRKKDHLDTLEHNQTDERSVSHHSESVVAEVRERAAEETHSLKEIIEDLENKLADQSKEISVLHERCERQTEEVTRLENAAEVSDAKDQETTKEEIRTLSTSIINEVGKTVPQILLALKERLKTEKIKERGEEGERGEAIGEQPTGVPVETPDETKNEGGREERDDKEEEGEACSSSSSSSSSASTQVHQSPLIEGLLDRLSEQYPCPASPRQPVVGSDDVEGQQEEEEVVEEPLSDWLSDTFGPLRETLTTILQGLLQEIDMKQQQILTSESNMERTVTQHAAEEEELAAAWQGRLEEALKEQLRERNCRAALFAQMVQNERQGAVQHYSDKLAFVESFLYWKQFAMEKRISRLQQSVFESQAELELSKTQRNAEAQEALIALQQENHDLKFEVGALSGKLALQVRALEQQRRVAARAAKQRTSLFDRLFTRMPLSRVCFTLPNQSVGAADDVVMERVFYRWMCWALGDQMKKVRAAREREAELRKTMQEQMTAGNQFLVATQRRSPRPSPDAGSPKRRSASPNIPVPQQIPVPPPSNPVLQQRLNSEREKVTTLTKTVIRLKRSLVESNEHYEELLSEAEGWYHELQTFKRHTPSGAAPIRQTPPPRVVEEETAEQQHNRYESPDEHFSPPDPQQKVEEVLHSPDRDDSHHELGLGGPAEYHSLHEEDPSPSVNPTC